jgi:hypothetical protein
MTGPASGNRGIAPAPLSERDLRYIRTRFVPLRRISAKSGLLERDLRAWRTAGRFPLPAYVTPEGTEWYPPALGPLVRRCLSLHVDLRSLFVREFTTALAGLRLAEPALHQSFLQDVEAVGRDDRAVAESYWEVYRGGLYGVCLRVPWVPGIVQKGRLMLAIDELTREARPEDPTWGRRLRKLVESMDSTEMPFAEWDRVRFGGPVSRDRYVTEMRRRFPAAFGRRSVARPKARGGKVARGFARPSLETPRSC